MSTKTVKDKKSHEKKLNEVKQMPVVGTHEVCLLLGITTTAFHSKNKTQKAKKMFDAMPPHVAELGLGRVWNTQAILAWIEENKNAAYSVSFDMNGEGPINLTVANSIANDLVDAPEIEQKELEGLLAGFDPAYDTIRQVAEKNSYKVFLVSILDR